MPKRTRQIPQMRHYKPRNLARVRIDGQDVYLGKWGSDEVQQAYDRLIAEYLANGRRLPPREPPPPFSCLRAPRAVLDVRQS